MGRTKCFNTMTLLYIIMLQQGTGSINRIHGSSVASLVCSLRSDRKLMDGLWRRIYENEKYLTTIIQFKKAIIRECRDLEETVLFDLVKSIQHRCVAVLTKGDDCIRYWYKAKLLIVCLCNRFGIWVMVLFLSLSRIFGLFTFCSNLCHV